MDNSLIRWEQCLTFPQWGIGSSTGNGYREFLLDALQRQGATIDFVGTQRNGDFSDTDNEGHPGWTIAQIGEAAQNAYNAGITPDVVLLHAGTNDMYGVDSAYTADQRLGALVDRLHGGWPQATIIIAKIIPSTNSEVQANIEYYNSKIEGRSIEDQKYMTPLTHVRRCRSILPQG
jgi:lysophospholipase L1-like esterase